MENKTMERTLYKVLRKTGVPRDQIKPDASFIEDLNFDQLDWTLFVYYLEDYFKIQLEDFDINEFTLVNDIFKVVKRKNLAA
jgi:acyl carrier protein